MNTKKLLELNYNENSLGMSASARQAITNALDIGFRYPLDQRAELLTKIAEINGVPESQVSLGNGSSENIKAVIQMLRNKALEQDKSFQVVLPDPTFFYGELYAISIGVPVVKIALTPDNYDLNIAKLQKAADDFEGISLFYICNPNNPTGTIISTAQLKAWVENAPNNHYFLLDQAYSDYVTEPSYESGIEWVKQELSDNLIVVRTLSKLYALASMRVGYAISNPKTIEEIEDFTSKDNTNLSGAVAAIATLADQEFLALSLATTNQSRQMVIAALEALDLRYLPSQANFILHEIKGDVKTYIDRMLKQGIAVGREFPPITGFSRVTLGTPDEMKIFIETLNLFRDRGWL